MQRQKLRSNRKKKFGHRNGRSSCAHSIGKFFLCYIVLFSFETSATGSPGNYLYHMNHITCIYICVYHITSYHYVQRQHGKPLNLIWSASFDQLERRQKRQHPQVILSVVFLVNHSCLIFRHGLTISYFVSLSKPQDPIAYRKIHDRWTFWGILMLFRCKNYPLET